jgi:hypothetical protein
MRVKQRGHATVQCDEVSDPEAEPRELRHRWLWLARWARHVCHGHRTVDDGMIPCGLASLCFCKLARVPRSVLFLFLVGS